MRCDVWRRCSGGRHIKFEWCKQRLPIRQGGHPVSKPLLIHAEKYVFTELKLERLCVSRGWSLRRRKCLSWVTPILIHSPTRASCHHEGTNLDTKPHSGVVPSWKDRGNRWGIIHYCWEIGSSPEKRRPSNRPGSQITCWGDADDHQLSAPSIVSFLQSADFLKFLTERKDN